MKEHFLNVPSLALACLIIKCVIFGIPDSIAIVSLSALCAAFYYFQFKKPIPLNDKVQAELENLKKEIQNTKDGMNTVKLGMLRR